MRSQKRYLKKFSITALAGIDQTKTNEFGQGYIPSNDDGRTLLMKSGFEDVVTVDEEARVSFHKIYGINEFDLGNNGNTKYIDYTDEKGLQEAIWGLDKKELTYSMNHNDPNVDIELVETLIERSPGNIYKVKPGTAIGGVRHGKSEAGDYSLKLAKAGKFGLSFEGLVIESEIQSDDFELTKATKETMTIKEYLTKQLSKFTNKKNNGDTEMNKDEIQVMIDDALKLKDKTEDTIQDKVEDKIEDKTEETIQDKVEDKIEDGVLAKAAHGLTKEEIQAMIDKALKDQKDSDEEDKPEQLTKSAIADIIDQRLKAHLVKTATTAVNVEPNGFDNYVSLL